MRMCHKPGEMKWLTDKHIMSSCHQGIPSVSSTSAAYVESCSAALRHNGVASLMAPNLAKGLTLIMSALSWTAEGAAAVASGAGGDLPAHTAMGIDGLR